MTLLPVSYRFTTTDRDAIEALGYIINNSNRDKADFVNFLQSAYPNFNMLQLLQVVERIMIRATTLPIVKVITFDSLSSEVNISIHNHYPSETNAVIFQRRFQKTETEIVVHHDYFVLPETHRRLGLSKPVFQESLQQYINIGASKIHFHAGLSGGGYTWARHGFTVTNRDEVDEILRDARKKLFPAQVLSIEKIYNHYYNNPDPDYHHMAFPVFLWANIPFMKDVLRGSNWHGQLDLQNPEKITNFTNYVFRS